MDGMLQKYGPYVAQLYVQISYGTMFLITRLALTRGMSPYTYVVYRQIVAAVAICPVAYSLERGERPQLRLKTVAQIFLLAMLGVTVCQNLYYVGLAYTSSTMGSTMNTLTPAITFVMAAMLRLEEVRVGSRRGLAKILGTVVCVGGAMVMTLYKGPVLIRTFLLGAGEGHWILGSVLLFGSATAGASFLVYQQWVVKDYPPQLSLAALVCCMSTLQCFIVAIFVAEPSDWRLAWDLQLFIIAYAGILCSASGFFAQMWCAKKKGPVFATAFNPLSAVLAAIVEPPLLHASLYCGSLLGMMMVIGGLYSVLWGKASDGQAGSFDTAAKRIQDEGKPLLAESNNSNADMLT